MKAIQNGRLTVGFIGGSITDARGCHNWPEPVLAWLCERFPDVQIVSENAAIGATGSALAVFRAERDLIERGCDLVFVEYAVNDYSDDRTRRRRTREGLFRKLLRTGKIDVVAVYTYMREFYADMEKGGTPESIADFEELCEHYGVGSVWMSRYALDEVLRGRMRWEEWLPDGLHPQERGSYSYGQSVIAYLEKELSDLSHADEKTAELPAPLDPLNWENTAFVPFDRLKKSGPWLIRRSVDLTWMDQILYTSAPGSAITVEFEARAIAVGFDFGKKSAEVRYSIDGGEPVETLSEKAAWAPDSGWYYLRVLADGLGGGAHTLTVESLNRSCDGMPGTRCEIAFVGLVL